MAKNFFKVRNGLGLVGLSAAPSDPQNGDVYYDTTQGQFQGYQNGAWGPLGGSSGSGINLLASYNPGGEQGTTNWTASAGTFTTDSTAANVGYGTAALTWTPTASAQTLSSTAATIPAGLYGRNGYASAWMKMPTSITDLLMQVVDGSGNVLNQVTLAGTGSYALAELNYIHPSSGSVKLVFKTQTTQAQFWIDQVYLGDAANLTQVSQASYFGTATFPYSGSSCDWRANAAVYPTLNSFQVQSGTCSTPTISGNLASPTATTLGFNVPSLPPGQYTITVQCNSSFSSGSILALSDGTTTSTSFGADTTYPRNMAQFTFKYTVAQSNVQFKLVATSGADINVYTAGSNVEFQVIRYPLTSELAVTPNTTPTQWTGAVNGCSSGTFVTTTGLTDMGTCAGAVLNQTSNTNMGTVSMGSGQAGWLVFNPPVAGTYEVCASGVLGNSGGGNGAIAILDASGVVQQQVQAATGQAPFHLCVHTKANSVTAQTIKLQSGGNTSGSGLNITNSATGATWLVQWTIKNISQGMNAPLLVGSVTSNTASAERIERAYITCTGSGCTITSQSGSWISSVTRTSTGVYVVNFSSGMFSGAPMCTLGNIVGQTFSARLNTIATTSNVGIATYDSGQGAVDGAFQMICMGQK